MSLIRKDFPYTEMKLTNIYSNPILEHYPTIGTSSPLVAEVYGTPLNFPEIPNDRPYIYGSFVTTIDGKLAYKDYPGAFEVAGRNAFAKVGSLTDFWWLNVLRSSCDALILGAKSISLEEDYLGYSLDQNLEQHRIASGNTAIPINIIVSTDCHDIPLDHLVFHHPAITSYIAAAPDSIQILQATTSNQEFFFTKAYTSTQQMTEEDIEIASLAVIAGKQLVILTGTDSTPDITVLMAFLRKMGIQKLLIESPTYAHLLIKEELFDEGFFNMSCVYIGGDAVSLGYFDTPFKAVYHPHTELLSIAMHSPHMLFFRHKFIYGVKTEGNV